MNNPNLKKRRPFVGHEGISAVHMSQASSSIDHPHTSATSSSSPSIHDAPVPTTTPSYRPDYLTTSECQVLQQAASILQCPLSHLLELNQSSRLYPHAPPPPHTTSHKRPRLCTDMSVLPSHEKRSASTRAPDDYPRESPPSSSFSFSVDGSRLANCLASFCSPCTTAEPPAYMGVPTTNSFGYSPSQPLLAGEKSVAQSPAATRTPHRQQSFFGCDDPSMASPAMSAYPALQPSRPMTLQPSTRAEGMVYPEFSTAQRYPTQPQHVSSPGHVMTPGHYRPTAELSHGTVRSFNDHDMPPRSSDGSESLSQRHTLEVVMSNERPQPTKRGPFKSSEDREKTAQTRKLGSCIRCRMQRIRCEINPKDENGICLTCQKVSSVKIWRLPCLRYKLTDVRLFKPGQVKGYEWTQRWAEGIADDISQWQSGEIKIVKVSEGHVKLPVDLRVRRFIPQQGDSLERTWMHGGNKRKVWIPPYAIVNLEEARSAYTAHIQNGIQECCTNLLSHKERMLLGTYFQALKVMKDPNTPPKEKELLTKALRLWMAIRVTTKSTIIVGDETLGMPHDILDETSPLRGCIPLPPVMGAQIELVLTQQIQTTLRHEMLDDLQAMTQANKHRTWFTTYLVTFILLHNVALLCQHDAGYARKHGIERQFAREDMVREYQMGANILLAYFHYCNKGIYPFSAECKDQDLKTLAELDDDKMKFVQSTRKRVEMIRESWRKMRERHDYENDFYFISQLYEENWMPQATI